jgi:hypothetical protein
LTSFTIAVELTRDAGCKMCMDKIIIISRPPCRQCRQFHVDTTM